MNFFKNNYNIVVLLKHRKQNVRKKYTKKSFSLFTINNNIMSYSTTRYYIGRALFNVSLLVK